MNICLISREYPPETGWGGIGTYTHSLAHGLAENGQGVYVLSYATGEEPVYKDGKVTVHRVKPKGMRGMWRLNSFFPVSPVLYSRRIAARLAELVSTCKIDIVETPEWQAEIFWYLFKKINTGSTAVSYS